MVGAAAAAGLRFVLAHGETAATIMAATYADLTGTPGAVVVTRGPGLASAVNGIAHAALDRLPLVVIADTVPSATPRISHQRIDQDALGRSVAKAAITVGGPRAADRAAEPSVPRWPPRRAPWSPTWTTSAPDLDDPGRRPRPPARGGTRSLRRRDAGAGRGAGRGPAAGGAAGNGAIPRTAAVRKVLAGSGVPVLHTYRARGVLPDSAAEAAGLVTGGTMEWPLLSAADLIVGLGVDEAEMIPAPWDYAGADHPGHRGRARGPRLLHRRDRADHTAGPGPGRDGDRSRPRLAGRRGAAVKAARRPGARRGMLSRSPGRLAPQQVVRTVRDGTPAETIATVDAGAHMLVAMPLWEVTEPGRLLISSGLATMGYALPAAIAAALCAPRVPVVAFTGDGGLGMTLAELETAVRLSLQVIVVVFNDAVLSLIEIKQKPAGQGGAEAVRYRPVSFAAPRPRWAPRAPR